LLKGLLARLRQKRGSKSRTFLKKSKKIIEPKKQIYIVYRFNRIDIFKS
jgi:hypothetical protein